jgi:hypothetical protein
LIHEIVDINFGKKDITEIKLLAELAEAKKTFHTNCNKLKKRDEISSKEIDALEKENESLVKKFDETKGLYFKELTKDKGAHNENLDKRNPIDKMINPESRRRNMKRAYITFRHMDGFEHVVNAYKQYESKWSRAAASKNYFAICRRSGTHKEDKAYLKSLYFFKKWPEVTPAEDPGNIMWPNLGKSVLESKIRVGFSWAVAVIALLCSLAILAAGKSWIAQVKKLSGSSVICPSYMSKLEAHLDAKLPLGRQYGKMSCYCKQNLLNPMVTFNEYNLFNFENYKGLFNEYPYNSKEFGYTKEDQEKLDILMTSRGNIFEEDKNQYCIEWSKNYWIG